MDRFLKMDDLSFHLVNSSEYSNILKNTGFNNVQFSDMTSYSLQEAKLGYMRVAHDLGKYAQSKLGEAYFNHCVDGWRMQVEVLENSNLKTNFICAQKTAF